MEVNGANNLVEIKREIKYANIKIKDIIRSMQQEDIITTINFLGDDDGIEDIGLEETAIEFSEYARFTSLYVNQLYCCN